MKFRSAIRSIGLTLLAVSPAFRSRVLRGDPRIRADIPPEARRHTGVEQHQRNGAYRGLGQR